MAKTSHTTKPADLPVGSVVKLKRKKNVLNAQTPVTIPDTSAHDAFREISSDFSRTWIKVSSTQTAKVIARLTYRARQVSVRRWSVFIGTVALALVSIGALGIYGLGWNNSFTGALSVVVPYPALSVDGTLVRYHEFYNNVVKMRAMTKGSSVVYTSKQLNDQSTQKTIGEALSAKYAREHDISVTNDDVKTDYDRLVTQDGGGKAGEKKLLQQAGIIKSLVKSELRSRLISIKVDQALTVTPESLSATSVKAQGLITQLNTGADIDKLAAAYSAIPNGQMTGDKAYVVASILPRNVNLVASRLNNGQVAAAPININGTFYILKRIKAEGNNVIVRVIVIRSPGLSAWLSDQLTKDTIVKYLPQLH